MKYDLFISHASEDKKAFVDPLALSLRSDCYRVWYDRFALNPGASLRRSIDEGLAESAVGVVVLSPNFFLKEWALRELDALMGQQISDGKPLIPIWLNLTHDEVARASPQLADRIAIDAARGFGHVLSQLKAQINATDKCTDRELDEVVARFFDANADNQGFLERRCLANFSKLVGYYNAYDRQIDEIVGKFKDGDEDDLPAESDRLMQPWLADAHRHFDIPNHVYLYPGGPVSREDVKKIEARLSKWCAGSIGQLRSAELIYDLDEWLDADYLFVFFGIPNFRVSPTQREVLNQAVINVGSRALAESPVAWGSLYQRVLKAGRRRNSGGRT